MRPSVNAGKYVTGKNRGKICNRWEARENLWSLISAGKHVSGGKRGEYSQLMKSTGEMKLDVAVRNE